jgi:2-isopropylmalate synthase
MNPDVELYDTTLRDGSQGEGVNFSAADKIRIAEQLDIFGIDIIEGGWPGSNPKDMEFFEQAKRRKYSHAKISAFSMTRRKGVKVEEDELMRQLLAAETPVVCIVGKTWLLHVKEVLRCTPDENLAMISDTIRFFKDKGKIVYYDAEHSFDGYKNEPEYAMATWRAAEAAGADAVVLCDTNGGCLPDEISGITKLAKEKLLCGIGIHTHNDIGLGVANALTAIEAGATQVQGTINGYGERTGNCNLTVVIPNLFFKMKKIQHLKDSMPKLRELSHFVDEVANFRPDPRQPWVGATAFAHKGGMHVHAVDRVVNSYEHIAPESVGNSRRVLVSDMSGRSNILMKARELGFNFTNETPELKTILARIKELESQGYEFEAAEGSLALLIRKALKHEEAPFKVDGYHVSMRRDGPNSVCEATIKVRVGEKRAHTVAEGDGPVNALDRALRSALSKFFPALESIQLTDYKVRILDSDTGTAAKTRVLLESSDGQKEWGTVGLSENIIDASLHALVDSIEYYLAKAP